MFPTPSPDLFLVIGGLTAGLLLLGGCVLMFLCLAFGHRSPRPTGKRRDEDDEQPGWLAQALAVLLGGGLLLVTCLWWAGLHVLHTLRPSGTTAALVGGAAPLAVNLFPWD
jgi:hypothetical protein